MIIEHLPDGDLVLSGPWQTGRGAAMMSSRVSDFDLLDLRRRAIAGLPFNKVLPGEPGERQSRGPGKTAAE